MLLQMHSRGKIRMLKHNSRLFQLFQRDWIHEAMDEWKNDEKIWTFIQKLQQDPRASNTFRWKDDLLWYKDRLYLGKSSQLKQKVLFEFHSSPIGGHLGFLKTYHGVKTYFFGWS